MRKSLISIGGVTMALLLAAVVLTMTKGAEKKTTSGLPSVERGNVVFPVTAVIVRRGDLVRWINTAGYAYPVMENEVKMRIAGQVVDLDVYNGKRVHAGDTLMRLDDRESGIVLKQAEDALLSAQIEYNFARMGQAVSVEAGNYRSQLDSLEKIYDKARDRFVKGLATGDEVERAKRDYDVLRVYTTANREDIMATKTGLSRTMAQCEDAKLKLSYGVIEAPFGGVVADCEVEKGSFVQPGLTVMRLMDISAIRLNCEVTEMDLPNIRIGDKAEVEFVTFAGRISVGKVVRVNPVIDLQKRTAVVSVEVKNPGTKIKPGMYATLRIAHKVVHDVVVVPNSAVLFREDRPLVFTVLNGEAQWVYVILGATNGNYYEIEEGLSNGDTVVVDGNYNLAHAARVTVAGVREY